MDLNWIRCIIKQKIKLYFSNFKNSDMTTFDKTWSGINKMSI